jgi:hypothetical protein
MEDNIPLSHRIVSEGIARRKVIDCILKNEPDDEVGRWHERWRHSRRDLWQRKYGILPPEGETPWNAPEEPYLTPERVRANALAQPFTVMERVKRKMGIS